MNSQTHNSKLDEVIEPQQKEKLALAKSSLQQGKFEACISTVNEMLTSVPKHIEGLYLKAVAQRYNKQYNLALETLDVLNLASPEYGRSFQEQGHNYLAKGQKLRALKSYQRACAYNPGLESSWKAQVDILLSQNRTSEAKNAQGFYERLRSLPRELHSVTNLLHEGRLIKAERICKNYLMKDKTNVEGMRLLADIANRLGAKDESEFLYETALELEPKNVSVLMDFVSFLKSAQKPKKALKHAKFLNETYPANPMLQSIYAIQCLQVGNYDEAMSLFDAVLKRLPNDPITLTSKGHAYKTYGLQEEAIKSYRKAFDVKPDHGEAYFSLANLKTYNFLDSEVKTMETVLASEGLTLQNRANLSFSLGKAYEDKKDYKTSFEFYDAGNEYKRIQSRYDIARMSEEMAAQKKNCTSELFKEKRESGHKAPDPIFILGLPRAGSTLLEQIIASHSQVDGTLELPNILTLANRLSRSNKEGVKYPENLTSLSAKKLEELGKAFIEDTQIHRQGAPFFIDKMPNNFRHIGLIHLILPNAKIIDARRHPMACCFSGFKQNFAEGQEFTYGLEQIGQYYRDYVELMDHWDEVLPDKVLRVQYEDVVADTEAQVRRILDYLNLPFEQSCVEFHKTERSVRTASSEQVRQPIFKSGLEQWRNFEPWLDPLKEALGPILDRYPIN